MSKELESFEIQQWADAMVKALRTAGVETPAIFIAVHDIDSGAIVSTGNLKPEHEIDMLKWVIEQREKGQYFEEVKPIGEAQ